MSFATIPMTRQFAVLLSALLFATTTAAACQNSGIDIDRSGNGEPIVLIPGLASSGDVWGAVASELSQSRQVHVVNLPGFGGQPSAGNGVDFLDEMATALADYLEASNLTGVTLVGHSLGGALALKLSAEHPERIDRLVVVDSMAFLGGVFARTDDPAAVETIAAQARDRALAADQNAFLNSQRQTVCRMVTDPGDCEAILETASQSDPVVVANAMYDLQTTDLRPLLEGIGAQTLVIYAYQENPYWTSEQALQTYRDQYANLDGVVLTEISDSRHFVMIDQHDRFMQVLRAFLDEN